MRLLSDTFSEYLMYLIKGPAAGTVIGEEMIAGVVDRAHEELDK